MKGDLPMITFYLGVAAIASVFYILNRMKSRANTDTQELSAVLIVFGIIVPVLSAVLIWQQ